MKNILFVIALFGFFCSSSHAYEFGIITNVSKIRHHVTASTLNPAWAQHTWFSIKDEVPGCGQFQGETLLHLSQIDIDQWLPLLLAAKVNSIPVEVIVDPGVKVFNYCELQYLTLQ